MRLLLLERIAAAAMVWAAGALLSALELGVVTELGKGPRTRLQLQRRLGLAPASAADFLDALVGLGWLDREGDDDDAVYLNTRESGHFLDRRESHYLGDLLQAGHESLRTHSVARAGAYRALRTGRTRRGGDAARHPRAACAPARRRRDRRQPRAARRCDGVAARDAAPGARRAARRRLPAGDRPSGR
jgi:DNA-binding MarR family transcriptional regulator